MTRRRLLWIITGTVLGAVLCVLWVAQFRELSATSLPEFQSYFIEPQFVDRAFASVGDVQVSASVSMVLINHHLLAPNLIARALAHVATHEPVTVVLIAPDHFARGIAPISSVIACWPTPFGVLESATTDIKLLSSAGLIHLDARPFALEHGITNVTMFLAKALPNAQLIPLILRSDTRTADSNALVAAIVGLSGRVVVIGSFDFTHEATDAVARANDKRSVRILTAGNPAAADGIAVDSTPGIRIMMRIAQLRGLQFSLLDSTNSARIMGNLGQGDVTSYITGIWAPEQ